MVTITIKRSENGLIKSFTLSGHANFRKHGQDIVCAGASAVSFGTINAIAELTKTKPNIKQGGKGGFLRCEIPEDVEQATQEKMQLLLEGMIISLQTIEKDYGKHIKIVTNA